jgi:hypothetical protein
LVQILPCLFACGLVYAEQNRSENLVSAEKMIKDISDETRLYQEKIEAYRKISTPFKGIPTSRRTSVLINKLRSMNSKPMPRRSFTEDSDHDSNSSEVDLELSKNSSSNNESSGPHSFVGSEEKPPAPTITNDEIKEIINTLISQEYLMLNPEKCKDAEMDLMALAKEAKNVYTQMIENLPGSSHKTIKIPKVKLKHPQHDRAVRIPQRRARKHRRVGLRLF